MEKEARTITLSLTPDIWRRIEEELLGVPDWLRPETVPSAVEMIIEIYYNKHDFEVEHGS